MKSDEFIDHYEVLNLSPKATLEDIERNFRNLAREFHPDNQTTGSRYRFDCVVQAHGVLRDPAKRARYHGDYRQQLLARWNLKDVDLEDTGRGQPRGDGEPPREDAGIERDLDVQNKLLTRLYLKRRTNIKDPGIGDAELERLTGCPPEHLEFHLWYMKEKGWIRRSEDGQLAITIEGVDRATLLHQSEAARKYITDQS
jgi:curved DNA-binding protein CbpA